MADPYVDAGLAAGLPPALAQHMGRYVHIESGGNPNARTGSYTGVLQMGPDERTKYGGNGLASGAAMYADKAKWFASKYGRDPTPTELYLTNQQGQGGVAAHMGNPTGAAWRNMYNTAEGQQKGEAWAKQAVWGNVPDTVKAQYPGGVDSLTSQQFLDLWKNKVEGGAAAPFSPVAPQPPPEQPAQPAFNLGAAVAQQQPTAQPAFNPTGQPETYAAMGQQPGSPAAPTTAPLAAAAPSGGGMGGLPNGFPQPQQLPTPAPIQYARPNPANLRMLQQFAPPTMRGLI